MTYSVTLYHMSFPSSDPYMSFPSSDPSVANVWYMMLEALCAMYIAHLYIVIYCY
jgi:hypothetical protein